MGRICWLNSTGPGASSGGVAAGAMELGQAVSKLQIPSTKRQESFKPQAPLCALPRGRTRKSPPRTTWNLEPGVSLELGAWCLEFKPNICHGSPRAGEMYL